MKTRTFFIWIAAIVAPFVLIFATVIIVDPYAYFDVSHAVSEDLKKKNLYHTGKTMAFSNLMWKLVEFQREPKERILLGDSRLSRFDLDYLEETSGDRYYNFGVPGGNTTTITDIFGYANENAELKEVVVQIAFRAMNKGFDWDLYTEPSLLVNEPLMYLTNRRVIGATVLNLQSSIAPNTVQYDVTPSDQWQIVLNSEREYAASFDLDSTIYDRLQVMMDSCAANGVELRFVEYPTHPEVQKIYEKAGLEDVRQEYIETLSAMAPTIDLDRPGLFPEDKDLWRDPLHLSSEAQRLLISKVWGE